MIDRNDDLSPVRVRVIRNHCHKMCIVALYDEHGRFLLKADFSYQLVIQIGLRPIVNAVKFAVHQGIDEAMRDLLFGRKSSIH